MTATRPSSRALGAFNALLLLYPRAFRKSYGPGMRDVFVESYRRTASAPPLTRARFWVRTLRDVAVNAMGVRIDARRGAARRMSRQTGRPVSRSWWPGVRDGLEGVREATRNPGFMLLCVAVLGIGGAALITVAAVAHTALLAPLPYGSPDRTVLAWGSNAVNGQLRDVVSGPVALALQRENHTLDGLAAFKPDGGVVMQEGRPSVLDKLTVTIDFFDVLRIAPWLGRWFNEDEGYSTHDAVAVVSHGFWRDALGADSTAVGRRFEIDGRAHTLIGVMGPDFFFPHAAPDIVVPLYRDVLASEDRTSYNYWLIGRLRSNASMGAASADLNSILASIAEEDLRLHGWSILVEPLQESVVRYARPAIVALVVAVGFVWLIAVINVANLFLMRITGRRHALAIRQALGASRSRIATLLLAECATVVAMSYAVALAAAATALGILGGVMSPTVPIPGSAARVALAAPELSGPVVAMSIGVFAVGLVFLAAPVLLHGARPAEAGALRGDPRTQSRTRRTLRVHKTLIAVELATATLLLVGAGLAVRTTLNLLRVDSGLDREGVLSMYVGDLSERTSQERVRFFDAALRQIADVPGVLNVGLNDYVPLQNEDDFEGVRFPDRPPPPPGQGPREEWRRVSHDYFAAAGVSLIAGRLPTHGEDATQPSVAVINRAFADRYYPDRDPLGKQVLLTNQEYGLTEIVGVVDNVRRRGLDREAPPVVYVPFHRRPRPNMAVFVRTAGDPRALIEPVRAAIWSVDPRQPIDRVFTLEEVIESSIGVPQLTMSVVSVLAMVALLLAAAGVFGVTGYSVRLRRQEIGIRVALGATPQSILGMVVGGGLALTALGLLAGFATTVALGRGLDSLLFGVDVIDPLTFVCVGAVLAGVAAVSSYLPARAAAGVDPLDALRID